MSYCQSLRQSLTDCSFTSREFHKDLDDLADRIFRSGNPGEIGSTKNVYKQTKHEGLKVNQKHESIFLSTMELKSNTFRDLIIVSKRCCPIFQLEAIVVGLWTEKDVKMFHLNALKFAFMGDATGSIAIYWMEQGISHPFFQCTGKLEKWQTFKSNIFNIYLKK